MSNRPAQHTPPAAPRRYRLALVSFRAWLLAPAPAAMVVDEG
jgi:hypothetical protein